MLKTQVKIGAYLLFFGFAWLITGCGPQNEAPESSELLQTPGTEQVTLKLSGMTCENCARGIETKITQLSGVSAVKVDFIKSTATINYFKGQIDVAAITKAIDSLGKFKVVP
jgi:copper chaperone CopZ